MYYKRSGTGEPVRISDQTKRCDGMERTCADSHRRVNVRNRISYKLVVAQSHVQTATVADIVLYIVKRISELPESVYERADICITMLLLVPLLLLALDTCLHNYQHP
ncbi:hypothetical protein QAD02_016897 [Eretmocerus hayati]|uniref:Uncharacterized protein n=1 Tax=Eretmocerus hayati TaxID=131215 RepID=A0ACC2PCH1_9HYME|nr:hypothetical protein QAD02_016897 [Eretmocerus hayati]